MLLPRPSVLALAAALSAAGLAVRGDVPATLTDAQIAHIAVTANQLDVAAARQALDRSSSDEVRAFAQTMIRDHEAVIAQAMSLAKDLGVTPVDNDTSRSLSAEAGAIREKLSKLKGSEFDRAYIDNEVAYHQAVIDAVRNTLIPATHNARLKKLLQDVLPALEAHLERARRLSTELRG